MGIAPQGSERKLGGAQCGYHSRWQIQQIIRSEMTVRGPGLLVSGTHKSGVWCPHVTVRGFPSQTCTTVHNGRFLNNVISPVSLPRESAQRNAQVWTSRITLPEGSVVATLEHWFSLWSPVLPPGAHFKSIIGVGVGRIMAYQHVWR